MPKKKQDETEFSGLGVDIGSTAPETAGECQNLDTMFSSGNTSELITVDAGSDTDINADYTVLSAGDAINALDENLLEDESHEPSADADPVGGSFNEPEVTEVAASKEIAPESHDKGDETTASQKEPDSKAISPLADDSRPKPAKPARKKNILDLNLNELDRNLSADDRKAWQAIYASYRSKSIMSGTVIGVDMTTLDVMNLETRAIERTTLNSLVIIDHRAKVLIPETEMWMPGTERPPHVMRNMAGGALDYVIMEIDREGECAIGSRRAALAAKRHFFSKTRVNVKHFFQWFGRQNFPKLGKDFFQ